MELDVTCLQDGNASPEYLDRDADCKYVGLRVLFIVATQDAFHGIAGLVGGAGVDVDAVGITRSEVEGEECFKSAWLLRGGQKIY